MSSAAPALSSHPAIRVERRTRFFVVMSGVILALVLIGFARTLYLRALFDVPPISAYRYFHGAVLTSWFVWLFLQSALIGSGRTQTHRKLGIAALVLGPLVVIACLTAMMNAGAPLDGPLPDWNADAAVLGIGITGVSVAEVVAPVLWSNFSNIVSFVVLLTAAMLLRRRPQAHKRLMLLASLAVLGPALARIARWPGFGSEQGPFVTLVLLALLLAIVAHDLYSTRRVHPATIAGGAALVLITMASTVIGGSELGRSILPGIE